MSVCQKCGWWERICHCKDLEVFNTSRDKLWEFNTLHNGKNYEIRTKRQWRRFMKSRGLHDDVNKKPEFDKVIPKVHTREQIVESVKKELYNKGVYDKLRRR